MKNISFHTFSHLLILLQQIHLFDTIIEGKNLVGKFVNDIVLRFLSFVGENERNNNK